ncbi:Dynein heavy chain, cytosolic (DYHC) [Scheffersomyces stipitis CBS 6054]|uniref:Dynein heavy chain, cytoplasmic n=1 Tax=Scheffersomyces stipitis (strain ATCC 58785 / CBS 6054 / NBRC 10063 / NRRL Y-11545) TaxID=322104 RepID=A3LZU2_PICST|nr:Dynein heavy chain, cytosolic (DYHC) [Scheffersomyces stipitis CBS 6054]ABN68600.2 Dynein heavy chain, cytosolic (DYHC) [Scheffersomyces stipitis CBS 6054]
MDSHTSILEVPADSPLLAEKLSSFIGNFLALSANSTPEINFDQQTLQLFINNHNADTLYIVQYTDESYVDVVPELAQSQAGKSAVVAVIILIKSNKGPLISNKPLTSQLNILNIPNTTTAVDSITGEVSIDTVESFERLRSLVALGLTPYFDLITSNNSNSSTDSALPSLNGNRDATSSQNTVNAAKKKLNELTLSLQHLQEQIQIPDLLMTAHPKIKNITDNGVEISDEILEPLVSDSILLNELTNIVNNWIKQIQSVTKLDHNPWDGDSIIEELSFWRSLEIALTSISQQIAAPEVTTTIDVLNKAKRFHVTLSFQNDTGLQSKINTTKVYNSLFKDFPIEDFISDSENVLEKFEIGLHSIFNHLKSRLKNLNLYPLGRSIQTIEVIIVDVTRKFSSILTTYSLTSIPMSEFNEVYNSDIMGIFNLIDQNLKYLVNLLRETLRKRQEKFIIIQINHDGYDKLRERLDNLKLLRSKHEDLLVLLESILPDNNSVKRLLEAYNKFIIASNALDISSQGTIIWQSNERGYLSVSQELSSLMTLQINALFDKCHTFTDFLSIIDQFQPLLNSTSESQNKIMNLTSDEYKLRLLTVANSEVEQFIESNLNNKTFMSSSISVMNDIQAMNVYNDEFLLVSEIILNNGLVSKLKFYLKNLEKSLGTNWNKYSIGTKLNVEVSNLLVKLDTDQLFENWIKGAHNILSSHEMGPLVRIHHSANNEVRIDVNIDTTLLEFCIQATQLRNLGYSIPTSISLQLSKIENIYPLVVGLIEQIAVVRNVFDYELVETEYGKKFGKTLSEQQRKVGDCLKVLLDVNWQHLSRAVELQDIGTDSHNLLSSDNLVELQSFKAFNKFQDEAYLLYDQVNTLSNFHSFLEDKYLSLRTCQFDFEVIKTIISEIQQRVNKTCLIIENMQEACATINQDLKSILFGRGSDELSILSKSLSTDNLEAYGRSTKEKFTISIIFEQKSLSISPSVTSLKTFITKKITDIFSIIESQSTVFVDRSLEEDFHGFVVGDVFSTNTTSILNQVDIFIKEGEDYFSQWQVLQSLWELDLSNTKEFRKILPKNSDLACWLETINNVIQLRRLFDNGESSKDIGNCLQIDFSKVQRRVNLKFESFQNDIIEVFSSHYQSECIQVNEELSGAITSLECKLNLQSEVMKLVSDIEVYLKYKDLMASFAANLALLKRGQSLLTSQRFKFSKEWVFVEQIENDLSIVKALIQRKESSIDQNTEIISSKIRAESVRANEAIKSIKGEWSTKKPVDGQLNPSLAISVLTNFQETCNKLIKNKESISKVAASLDIQISIREELEYILEEISDLKSVWSSINDLWEALELLNNLSWSEVHTRTLRRQLDDLLTSSRALPANVRQYSAFSKIQNLVKGHIKNFGSVNELKGDAMKPRHWNLLFNELGIRDLSYESLSLRDVWSLNFELNQATIRAITTQAINEQIIATNLNKIEEEWSSITLEVFNYEDKCRLVKNWDVLLDQCKNDVNTLATMKNSPYYPTFEQDISTMESKLNRFSLLLDVWLEVQRQWVYLDGVFGNRANDIKSLLPIESTRFSNLSYELHNVLKRIYRFQTALDVLLITDIQSVFDKFHESLIKVRKSLADYLEKQRELFPRFYFVGNEDLLDIIGSSGDITRINRHLKKMFAGISKIEVNKENSTIVAVFSEEGEKVHMKHPVSLLKSTRLHELLRELEIEVKLTLALLIKESLSEFKSLLLSGSDKDLKEFIDKLPIQAVTVVSQIVFTSETEVSINNGKLRSLLEVYDVLVNNLISLISSDVSALLRKQAQYIVIEVLHQREILLKLSKCGSEIDTDYIWSLQQLFYFDATSDPLESVKVKHANTSFAYGFEYLGIPDKLAYTPLIEKTFLTMAQALDQNLGGSPYGPAGTGKTESVKALGNNLGKMTVVFCCDESFDFQSMGRILLGLCKVGSWGCFDEFNRLDKKMLSAISSQIETIEAGLRNKKLPIELSGKTFQVNPETGIFVTMNPGYVGRVELPENLKKLFRSCSMEVPDKEIIVDVILTSQTFHHSKELASIIVPFFEEIERTVSKQSHYDFGLRTLKNMLVKCGMLKRRLGDSDDKLEETIIVLQSIREIVAPKLVKEDVLTLKEIEARYFNGISYDDQSYSNFILQLDSYCEQNGLLCSEEWTTKALQLYQMQNSHHGMILVGSSGSGKTSIWKSVLHVLSGNIDDVSFVIDCKVLSKEEIYGYLDTVTRDWTDGLFTSILRRIRENLRGELSKRIWIVFDGDIDPEWAENLNSVLDDNKVLTLPNGERITLPPNVRLVFEVDSLQNATLATVSRCGMIWFDSSVVSQESLIKKIIHNLSETISSDEEVLSTKKPVMELQEKLVCFLESIISPQMLTSILEESQRYAHVMSFSLQRSVQSLSTLLKSYFRRYLECQQFDTTTIDEMQRYVLKALILSTIWAFVGDCCTEDRESFSAAIARLECFSNLEPVASGSYLDYDISLPEIDWRNWSSKVDAIDLEPHQVVNASTVVPTSDTHKHESLIYSILREHNPLVLCGPPGSGKTMTLLGALRKSPNMEVISLNFSKETSPKSLLQSLQQFCEFKKTNLGIELSPKISGKWVVVFCDEINLPAKDKYGTQKVISLLRQMIEHNGFWRSKDKQWISLSNIQFVGACNPPTDPGRNILSDRFLRHASVVMVDYPGKTSLYQIYHTFISSILKFAPDLRGFSKELTNAMIDVYLETKVNLNSNIQDHYIYSPRELTRWTRGILEALKSYEYTSMQSLVRLWYHEGMRLFYDRLVNEWEKNWTKETLRTVSSIHFPNVDLETVLKEPILYSNWLTSTYEPVDEIELSKFVSERLRVFSEEEVEVDLVLYQDLLDHALRIDRVLRQPQGHMILVGPSTSGKTTLARFVSWMNGLSLVQLAVNRNYGIDDFDSQLRDILLRCAQGEKICFIIEESSIMETSFVERMNTLLANAEIPGLFEEEQYTNLMAICMEQAQSQGLLLDSNEELYDWFTQQVSLNLHVVFAISDTRSTSSSSVISSPALFNRCVLSWMGDWSETSLCEISSKLLESVPLDMSNYVIPSTMEPFVSKEIIGFRDIAIDTLVYIHRYTINSSLSIDVGRTPSRFISFIHSFIKIFEKKQDELEENQRHISTGLDKLRETVLEVNTLKADLTKKQESLKEKDQQAKAILNKMLIEQNEAERKHEFSIATQEELGKQEIEIEKRRTSVLKDLEIAEPAVLEARRGVQNIKKQHLTEIRSMANPPAAVKLTMESVCILIGYQVSSWRDVQLVVRKDDFIANIVSFDSEEQLSSELREYMEQVYLSREDYNYEAVYRASKACGPLLQWVEAQLTYSKILQNIGPLREEVKTLERQTTKTRAQLIAIDQMINELEESIEQYKEAYSSLIRDAENIKSEMKRVESKVERSMKLIDDLTNERGRWKNSILKFGERRKSLIGDSILASAFLVYSGVYDERSRYELVKNWKDKLASSGILFDDTLTVSSYLTTSSQIHQWESFGLSHDTTTIENFTILNSCEFPLIIDPTSSVLNILVKSSTSHSVTVTSFLNEGYIKQVENALRFGGSIIIEDAEYYDPLLNSILKKEIQRNGGRQLIRLGEQLLDFSANFKLYLHSKDPSMHLSPFVSARTTIVNFSITTASLENKILDIYLRETQPDIDKKRSELVILQGEYEVRLHSLEEELLHSLSQSSGNILENDDVVNTLETLKKGAKEIDEKLKDSAEVMEYVDSFRNKFQVVSKHVSGVFTILEKLRELNSIYSFSLRNFIFTFSELLKSRGKNLEISEFVSFIYKEFFASFSVSLVESDKVTFALCLGYNFYSLEIGNHFGDAFLSTLKLLTSENKVNDIKEILLSCFARFSNEKSLDIELITKENADNETIQKLSLFWKLYSLTERGTSFFGAASDFTKEITGNIDYNSSYELNHWASKETTGPIIIASPDGYDATYKIEMAADNLNRSTQIISMGSKEGIEMANKEISAAAKAGNWIVIQNIQMSPQWLSQLEKRLEGLLPIPSFRLFLTCNISSEVPVSLISESKVLIYENQPTLRSIMLETFSLIPQEKTKSHPTEFLRVSFLLAWFHSILQLRLQYAPISFKKKYGVNDSDFDSAFAIISNQFEQFEGKTNVSPELIPWKKIAYIVGEITYGGKIDNAEDLKYVTDLASTLFRVEAFNQDFNLIQNSLTESTKEKLEPPEGIVVAAYHKWIDNLPHQTALSWIGLEINADSLLREKESQDIAAKVLKLHDRE